MNHIKDALKLLDDALYNGKRAEIILTSFSKKDPTQGYKYQKVIQLFLAHIGKAKTSIENVSGDTYRSGKKLPSLIKGSKDDIFATLGIASTKVNEAEAIVLSEKIECQEFSVQVAKARTYLRQLLDVKDLKIAA